MVRGALSCFLLHNVFLERLSNATSRIVDVEPLVAVTRGRAVEYERCGTCPSPCRRPPRNDCSFGLRPSTCAMEDYDAFRRPEQRTVAVSI